MINDWDLKEGPEALRVNIDPLFSNSDLEGSIYEGDVVVSAGSSWVTYGTYIRTGHG